MPRHRIQTPSRTRFAKKEITLAALLSCLLFLATAQAQQYQTGDIVSDFTLVDRATGATVSLYDFEGQIVFLEWFAYWCPFCQAAAEDIHSGIVTHYGTSDGRNPHGAPVTHIGLNLQAGAEELSQEFIDSYGLGLVLNDFDRGVASRFQPSDQPIFAIINGVANSPSHQQWELLYSRLGYGDLSQPVDTFRQVIDSVQVGSSSEPPTIDTPPEPGRVGEGSTFSFRVEIHPSNGVSYQWYKDGSPLDGATENELRFPAAGLDDSGSYHVVASNAAGEVSSEPVAFQVAQTLSGFLGRSGLPAEQRLPGADPDGDGFANLFEFLAQTEPDFAGSRPSLIIRPARGEGSSGDELRLSFPLGDNTIGYQLQVELSESPRFDQVLSTLSFEAEPNGNRQSATAPLAGGTLFARLTASPVEPSQ
ncbi:immunoglobulin domain-containing protein [Pelagicoccus sp. SDUM812003]|uniref:immunoglobulin domain-containing protein n=1 Tax=Pelagicoccus sp. SDUM812003 TaxID=3041267 RepID=UPI00280FEDD2|nr:immunoglobulin domain-containing protein [Pelagicoccus sp. SDUM812003]MDQ8201904.1 immunoglobulin domain-containing protein [Pelagicoccus sp. SDUM812003]